MPTNVTIDTLIRMSSAKGVVYTSLADGKSHSLATIRKAVKKHGNAGTGIGAVYGLGRILTASKFSRRLVINREKDTVQLVPAAKSAKPVVKKSTPPAKKAVAVKA